MPVSQTVTSAPPFIDAATVRALLSPRDAVAAIVSSLEAGFRPEQDLRRVSAGLSHGEFLLMPSEAGAHVGIKVLTVAPGNPDRGLERIQGLYLLLDRETLAPQWLIDGPALTDLRTPAVSFAATAEALLAADAPLDVVLYGAGHQGLAHLRTLQDLLRGRRPIGRVTAVVRNLERVDRSAGITHAAAAGDPQAEAATASAGLIVCSTTAHTPLFDGELVRDDAVVIAVGSHHADVRELDSGLMARADVVVEDVATALRESGDVVMAVAEGALDPSAVIGMADLLTGVARRGPRPLVFKSSGMSWEDLVIASAVVAQHERAEIPRS